MMRPVLRPEPGGACAQRASRSNWKRSLTETSLVRHVPSADSPVRGNGSP